MFCVQHMLFLHSESHCCRKREGSKSTSAAASPSSHAAKKPRLLGILRGGRQKHTFPKVREYAIITFLMYVLCKLHMKLCSSELLCAFSQGPRCCSIEEVLSKQLSCTHTQQSRDGYGGGQQGREGFNDRGSLQLAQADSNM